MWLILFLSIPFVHTLDCYFTVLYSNGSRSWCIDEDCSLNHIDIISIEDLQCRTNYLSLRFSSYYTYLNFLKKTSSRIPLSSFFSMGRPNAERLLQIEFHSPLDNDNLFKLNSFRLLTGPLSNIDTYEFIFDGKISKDNLTLFIDSQMFLSVEQEIIDTLRFVFNCSEGKRVEWELIKSIEHLPESPCPQQITFMPKDFIPKQKNSFYIILIISIAVVLILIFFFSSYYLNHRFKSQSISQTELISIVERF